MDLQLVQGAFRAEDALELLSHMIHIKINYHEAKIALGTSEEDVKYRESRIKKLQQELADLRTSLRTEELVNLEGVIKIN